MQTLLAFRSLNRTMSTMRPPRPALVFALTFALVNGLFAAPSLATPSQNSSTKNTSIKTSSPVSTSAKSGAGKKSVSKKSRSRRPRAQQAPTSDRIREIQAALAREGFYSAQPTGKWDAASIEAMKRFQTSQSLPPTGKFDARSLQKLGLGSDVAGLASPSDPDSSPSPSSAPQTPPPSRPTVPKSASSAPPPPPPTSRP